MNLPQFHKLVRRQGCARLALTAGMLALDGEKYMRQVAFLIMLFGLVAAWGWAGEISATVPQQSLEQLASSFQAPPDTARMWTWWFWLGDKVDQASITADLEAFKAQGFGGVTVFSIGGPGISDRGPDYMTPQWRELFKHAVREADRLGLGLSTILCSGWNCGGPWIKPEHALKKHAFAQLTLTGPRKYRGPLPQAKSTGGRYWDVAVHAFPSPTPTAQPLDSILLNYKCARASLPAQSPIRAICEAPLQPLPTVPAESCVSLDRVVDLTKKYTPGGVLEWEVPAGEWVVLRTGYTLTGKQTTWSSPSGTGFEADPFDAQAMDLQFQNIGALLAEDAGDLVGRCFKSVQIDSWESGCPNWTAQLPQEFQRRRGYDARPFFATLAGYVVGSSEITDRFLYDYRNTLAEMVADNYFGRLTQLAEAKGLIQQSEAAGVCHPQWASLDALKNLGRCAIPMGEFWQNNISWIEGAQNKNGKQTASAAHLYGKRIAAAEAWTSFEHWRESPATLKPTLDRAFCEGFNHITSFSSATRSGEGFPGTVYCAGTHFNRKVTWWNQARPFVDYVARCSHLLQQGLFVGDVLFYNGDGCPNFVPAKHVDPSLGPGYDYDVCNTEVLLSRLAIQDGRIVLPDGMSYHLLALPDRKDIPLDVLLKIKELVLAGLTVVGPKPEKATGLKDYPQCDARVQKLAAELWGTSATAVGEHRVGKGRVIWGRGLRELLLADGITPDFEFAGGEKSFVDFIHRRAGGVDLYFLVNRNAWPETGHARFRVTGKQPEFWDPVTGKRSAVAGCRAGSDGRMEVPLELPPHGSVFVVFDKFIGAPRGHSSRQPLTASSALKPEQELMGAWEVQFDERWFYPDEPENAAAGMLKGKVVFEKLVDWKTRAESAVRHFSGTASYRKKFDLNMEVTGTRLWLDLGTVKEVARVKLNDHDLGVVWCAPWRIEITSAVKAQGNVLEVEVTNLWPNRLIGDAQLPPEQRRAATNIRKYEKSGPGTQLGSSGLLGPVRICVADDK